MFDVLWPQIRSFFYDICPPKQKKHSLTCMEVSVHWHDYTSSSVSPRQTSSVAVIMTSPVALLLLLLLLV